jgi:hypothetical protein
MGGAGDTCGRDVKRIQSFSLKTWVEVNTWKNLGVERRLMLKQVLN